MKPHEERVVEEKRQLDERLAALQTFLASYGIRYVDSEEVKQMKTQESVMREYSLILAERIAAFTP